MDYVITTTEKAYNWGFSPVGHTINGKKICLNEKEVMSNDSLSGTLEERVTQLDGVLVDVNEAKEIMTTQNT